MPMDALLDFIMVNDELLPHFRIISFFSHPMRIDRWIPNEGQSMPDERASFCFISAGQALTTDLHSYVYLVPWKDPDS
jgi:hypothetical protein